jgi:hypothetical protein
MLSLKLDKRTKMDLTTPFKFCNSIGLISNGDCDHNKYKLNTLRRQGSSILASLFWEKFGGINLIYFNDRTITLEFMNAKELQIIGDASIIQSDNVVVMCKLMFQNEVHHLLIYNDKLRGILNCLICIYSDVMKQSMEILLQKALLEWLRKHYGEGKAARIDVISNQHTPLDLIMVKNEKYLSLLLWWRMTFYIILKIYFPSLSVDEIELSITENGSKNLIRTLCSTYNNFYRMFH